MRIYLVGPRDPLKGGTTRFLTVDQSCFFGKGEILVQGA